MILKLKHLSWVEDIKFHKNSEATWKKSLFVFILLNLGNGVRLEKHSCNYTLLESCSNVGIWSTAWKTFMQLHCVGSCSNVGKRSTAWKTFMQLHCVGELFQCTCTLANLFANCIDAWNVSKYVHYENLLRYAVKYDQFRWYNWVNLIVWWWCSNFHVLLLTHS